MAVELTEVNVSEKSKTTKKAQQEQEAADHEQAEHVAWRSARIVHTCGRCGGTGYFMYSNSGLWRNMQGRIVMHAFTPGVCDACWGSGDADRPWTDLRKLEQEHSEALAAASVEDLARAAGVKYESMRAATTSIADVLEQSMTPEALKAKGRPIGFRELTRHLATVIRNAIAARASE